MFCEQCYQVSYCLHEFEALLIQKAQVIITGAFSLRRHLICSLVTLLGQIPPRAAIVIPLDGQLLLRFFQGKVVET